MVVGAIVGVLATGALQAQQAPAAPPDPMKFTAGGSAAMFYSIKPDKVADFELFWSTLRSKVAAGSNADLKTQLDGLKMFKMPGDPSKPTEPMNYLFYIESASALSYSPIALLYESKIFERAEADQMFGKLKEALVNILAWPLTKVG